MTGPSNCPQKGDAGYRSNYTCCKNGSEFVYVPHWQCCGGNILQSPNVCCNNQSVEKDLCCNDTVLSSGQICCANTPAEKAACCNNTVLSSDEVCCNNKPVEKTACCNNAILPSGQVCCGNKPIDEKTGYTCCGNQYVEETTCCNNTILTSNQICCGNAVHPVQENYTCNNNVYSIWCCQNGTAINVFQSNAFSEFCNNDLPSELRSECGLIALAIDKLFPGQLTLMQYLTITNNSWEHWVPSSLQKEYSSQLQSLISELKNLKESPTFLYQLMKIISKNATFMQSFFSAIRKYVPVCANNPLAGPNGSCTKLPENP